MAAQSNNSMDVRAKQRLYYDVACFPLACVAAVSPHVISAVRCFVLKHKAMADLKIEQRRSAFPVKLREVKRRAKDKDASNKSLDVRRKQLLC